MTVKGLVRNTKGQLKTDRIIDEANQTKRCSKCFRWRPFSMFFRRDGGKLFPSCKCCGLKARGQDQKVWMIEGFRYCPKCTNISSNSHFRFDVKKHRYGQCRNCAAVVRRKTQNEVTKHMQENGVTRYSLIPEKNRRNTMLKKYGLTHDTYMDMYEAQDGVCYICKEKQEPIRWKGKDARQYLCVDHDHETGSVRKLLCNRCNFVVGAMEKTPALFEKYVDYVHEHKEVLV